MEQVVKYGDTYYIHLNRVEGPITLEFRYGQLQMDRKKCIQQCVFSIETV